ncbi:hypothetical protein VNI00_000218 [Paramarasmius palmivorus]|uniref:CBM1 domain-containing protein n=1 Tax=Paramarasmius palmivorus TaxID=297713 RepID=A0AAW0EF62_9AGAR
MLSANLRSLVAVALSIRLVSAVPVWGQCGGIGWTGSTVCDSGSTCVAQNAYYSQCIPGTGGSTDPPATTNPPTATTTSVPQSTSFSNPVLWEDLADLDVTRVGDTYYYSASTMHYSPGAPILRSYDLVNWEFIGHSVPRLDFNSNDYNLPSGGQAYVQGIWASTMKYRASNKTWYWIGCVDFSKTYIYTSSSPTGTWSKAATLNSCYYDLGLLIDDNDTMYVAYGNTDLRVAQLAANGLSEVKNQLVYSSTVGTLEGSRFYKRNGAYYILATKPASSEYVLKSTSGPFGPYSIKPLVESVASPIGGGNPHQGGLVDTPDGNWYYMAFIDAYPGGRVPTLAPVTWSGDGWPSVQLSPTGVDTFTSIGPEWEWNHNPDTNYFSINNGLVLRAATVTNDLYAARNTITHRILGPKSSGTIVLDLTNMADGDRAGLAMLRDLSAYIGVKRTGSTKQVVMVNGMNMNSDWKTTNTGTEVATANISGNQIWLRAIADISLRVASLQPSSTALTDPHGLTLGLPSP